jgi:3-deoxy-7-phosphoheptulonate synthase
MSTPVEADLGSRRSQGGKRRCGVSTLIGPLATTEPTWAPSSWRSLPAGQQPGWPDAAALAAVRERLQGLPPLVFAGEARALLAALREVCEGRAFLLQAGDCVESFRDVSAPAIREKLKVLLQMSAVLTYGATLPVIKVGRIAGQFAKPRTSATEVVDGIELPSFRGHVVHSDEPTPEARVPDPERLVQGYYQAASTLNLLRAFTKGGFADLTLVHTWNREFVASSPAGQRYEALADEIERALLFMQAIGIDLARERTLHEVDVWTSHEGILLDYEEPLTRRDSLTGQWYDCSAHMLWIGERTRDVAGAHVEFFAGVHNPVGVKIGPDATPADVVALTERLNPGRVPGRLTLITRMGAERVREALPPLLQAVREAEAPVVWVCDPMHANMVRTPSGRKTRHFDSIMAELKGFFTAHREVGTWPGGAHIEFTGEDVTECLGGSEAVLEEQLDHRYETLCDPRLNGRQSLDLAFRVAELMRVV